MYSYRAYGLNICSDICLSELIVNRHGIGKFEADVIISLENIDIPHIKPLINGKNFKVIDNEIYIFWDDVGTLKVHEGKKISINLSENRDEIFLRSILLGNALGTLMHQRGLLVLHASSVNIKGQSIAFLGDVGYGKSTTALAFNDTGYPLISDDILPVQIKTNSNIVFPGYPRLKLSSNVILHRDDDLNKYTKIYKKSSKYSFSLDNKFSLDPLPLKRIYILEKGNNLSIIKLNNQDALIELVKNSYCLPIFNNKDKISNLFQCSNLVKNVPVNRLIVPNSLDKLPEIVKMVENDIMSSK